MNTAPIKRIQYHRQSRNERFALASFHFGDLATVKRNTPHQLDIEMTLAKGAFGGFTNQRKHIDQTIVL